MSEFIAGGADINQAAEPQLIRQHVEDNAFHLINSSMLQPIIPANAQVELALNIRDLFAHETH